jgi:putative phosphoesterase
MRIGVISDTHGLLREAALEALRGSDLIVHAGDVGGREILEALSQIAPVHAVRGNTDYGEVGATLPRNAALEIPLPAGPSAGVPAGEPTLVYVVHILEDMDLDPAAAGIGIVIYGHTHRPTVEWKGTVLYLNPGSAGPRRFDLPVTVARLEFPGGKGSPPEVELVDLDRAGADS